MASPRPAAAKGKANELFVMLPRRLFKAVRRGDLPTETFGVLVSLLGAADDDLEVVGTLKGFMDAIGWERSHDQLGRHLGALKAGGWIDYDSKPGQRKPYVIRITGAAMLMEASTYAGTYAPESPPVRRSTYAGAEIAPGGNAHGNSDQPTHDLREGVARGSTEQNRKDQQQRAPAPAREEPAADLTDGELQNLQRTLDVNGWWDGQIKEALARPQLAIAWLSYVQTTRDPTPTQTALRGLRSGELPASNGTPGRPPLVQLLEIWMRNVGWNYHDWETCLDEIHEREQARGQKLQPEELQQLQQLWEQLREEEPA